MRGRDPMTVDRRALLGAGGVLAMTAILRPARLLAQGSPPTRIGVIGSGNIGGTIAGDDPQAMQIAAALVRDAGFDPVTVGTLADARRFQRGQPGYGQQVSAAELKQKLSLP